MRIIVVIAITAAISCTKPNPNRCCTDEADCTAKGIPVGSICDQGLVCRGNQCIAQPCASSAECDAAAPFCIAELCAETCDQDSQCPGFGHDPANLYCVTGTCVVCRDSADCPASAPTCDMGTCGGCNSDSDCASAVCDVDTSTCIEEATVVYVSPTGSDTGSCTKADPCKLSRAYGVVDASRTVMKLAPGSHVNGGPGGFTTVKTVTMYGPATTTGLYGSDGPTIRVRDITFNGPVACTNTATNLPMTSLDLERVTIGITGSITVGACMFTMRKSKVTHDSTSRLFSVGGEVVGYDGATANRPGVLTIEQSVIEGGNPAIDAGFNGIFHVSNSVFKNQGTLYGAFQNGSTANTNTVRFTTFYNSLLKCNVNTGFFTSANNIYYVTASPPADTVTGTYCSHSYDLVSPQANLPAGPGNLFNMNPQFANVTAGDFHLLVGSPAIDVADPAATEAVDYEGKTRPQGSRRDMGAFEYAP